MTLPPPPSDDPADTGPIELEPLDLRPSTESNSKAPPTRFTQTTDTHVEVPDKPLHLCPHCDYILTGLRSRCCPECGTNFTLAEARSHARGQEPDALIDNRAMRRTYLSGIVGVLLILLTLLAPALYSDIPGLSFVALVGYYMPAYIGGIYFAVIGVNPPAYYIFRTGLFCLLESMVIVIAILS